MKIDYSFLLSKNNNTKDIIFSRVVLYDRKDNQDKYCFGPFDYYYKLHTDRLNKMSSECDLNLYIYFENFKDKYIINFDHGKTNYGEIKKFIKIN
jgi:hypothetical protein